MSTKNWCLIRIVPAVALVTLFACSVADAAYYVPCKTPQVVASGGTQPNVMFLWDNSGSMQFAAHLDPETGANITTWQPPDTYDFTANYYDSAYDFTQSYFGIFDVDTYYLYNGGNGTTPSSSAPNNFWYPANPQPAAATPFTVASTADGGTGTGSNATILVTTTTPHTFKVGKLVAFRNMSTNTFLNGFAWKVVSVPSNTSFTIQAQTLGPDNANQGTCLERLAGSDLNSGLSGNILNWMASSRFDISLMTLIGGRVMDCAACGWPSNTTSTGSVYINGISERSSMVGHHGAERHILPAACINCQLDKLCPVP